MVAIYAPRDHQAGGEADADLADPAAGYSRWTAPERVPSPALRPGTPDRSGARQGGHLSVVAPVGAALPARRRALPRPEGWPVEPVVRPARAPRRLPDRATRVRRRRLVAVVGLVLLAALVVVGARALASVSSVPPSPEPAQLGDDPRALDAPTPLAGHTYVVQPGDTLWSIARTIAPDRDPRPVVDALRRANGGPNLEVGERLTLDAG
jgi:LysM domain